MESCRNKTIQELKQKYRFLMMSSNVIIVLFIITKEIGSLMNMLSTSGKIYYSTYQQFISCGKSLITQEIIPPSIFYQLPVYHDEDDIYILEEDLYSYITEFYFIHSLYGTIM